MRVKKVLFGGSNYVFGMREKLQNIDNNSSNSFMIRIRVNVEKICF